MKRVLAVSLGIVLGGMTLQAADKKPAQEPGKKPSALSKSLEKYDKNNDGKLDDAEREALRAARKKEFMGKWDKNGDGKLDEAELKAFREDQQRIALDRAKQSAPGKAPAKQEVAK
jgi:hypothetical protein